MKFFVYVYQEEKEYGPYSPEEVIESLYEGGMAWTDAIRGESDTIWSEMGDVFDLEELQVQG